MRISSVCPMPTVENAAALVKKRRRHTHFTVDHLIDARVAPEVIELYRALIAEASARREVDKAQHGRARAKLRNPDEADLLSGSVSRLNAFVPERMAQIENLYRELLAASGSSAQERKSRNSAPILRKPRLAIRRSSIARSAKSASSRKKRQPGGKRSARRRAAKASASATEGYKEALPVFGRADDAAARLRSSARWQIANPVAALKAKLSSSQSQRLVRLWAFGKDRLRLPEVANYAIPNRCN